MSSETVYNWGIIGCGRISTDFAHALTRNSQSSVVACAARKVESARKFASEFGIATSKAYGSYDDILKDSDVDIVYVGTIHPSHVKSVVAACNNGKHVLCEKPIGMNAVETEEMIAAARKNKVFLMEAMWTRFFPAYRKARELISSGVIGNVVYYNDVFSRKMPSAKEAPRLWLNELGGGATLDLCCYTVNPLTWVFGCRLPKVIQANGVIDKEHNVDSMISATFVYSDKQFAQVHCNFSCSSFEERLIVGTKGRIRMHAPSHAPTRITLELMDEHGETGSKSEVFEFQVPYKYETEFEGSEGMMYEVQEVVRCLDEGRLQSPNYTWEETLTTMKILDEMRRQVGLKYKQDSMSSKL